VAVLASRTPAGTGTGTIFLTAHAEQSEIETISAQVGPVADHPGFPPDLSLTNLEGRGLAIFGGSDLSE